MALHSFRIIVCVHVSVFVSLHSEGLRCDMRIGDCHFLSSRKTVKPSKHAGGLT